MGIKKGGANNGSNKAKIANSTNAKGTDGNMMNQIIIIIVVIIVTIIFCFIAKSVIMGALKAKRDSPFLLKGSKNAKNSMIISQDPKAEGSVTLYRSDDQDKGIEFTYTFWMMIDNLTYKTGEWKHVFHKGNNTSYPNRAPGVWIHPNKNVLRFYMNTHKNMLEYVDVDNIPLRKWICLGVVLNQRSMDIYFNGYLRKRHTLSSLPRQNFGDVWINMFGGFEGYMSRIRYHRRALESDEIEDVVKKGPSNDVCGDTGEMPPYLDDTWWFDN